MITVLATENFTANLQEIAAFWGDREYPAGFDTLLAELNSPAIPNLMRHPRMGRNFFSRQPQSIDCIARVQKLAELIQTLTNPGDASEVREYVMTDYLLLYFLSGNTIHLLTIKHHKQMSFDFVK